MKASWLLMLHLSKRSVSGLLILGAIVHASCGSEKVDPMSGADITASPLAITTSSTASPCDEARALNLAHDIALSLSVPPCVVLGAGASVASVAAERVLGGRTIASVSIPIADSIRVPLPLLPYDGRGCLPGAPEALRLRGNGPAGEERFLVQVACDSGTRESKCPVIFDPSKSPSTTSEEGETCIRWYWQGEADAFRAEIRYPSTAEAYAYVLDSESTSFLLPHDAAPHLLDSPERCQARKEYVVLVFAMRVNADDQMVAYGAVTSECRISK